MRGAALRESASASLHHDVNLFREIRLCICVQCVCCAGYLLYLFFCRSDTELFKLDSFSVWYFGWLIITSCADATAGSQVVGSDLTPDVSEEPRISQLQTHKSAYDLVPLGNIHPIFSFF